LLFVCGGSSEIIKLRSCYKSYKKIFFDSLVSHHTWCVCKVVIFENAVSLSLKFKQLVSVLLTMRHFILGVAIFLLLCCIHSCAAQKKYFAQIFYNETDSQCTNEPLYIYARPTEECLVKDQKSTYIKCDGAEG